VFQPDFLPRFLAAKLRGMIPDTNDANTGQNENLS